MVERVGVVGCGTMGAGVAALCAGTGLEVVVVVSGQDSLNRGRKRVESLLDRTVAKRGLGPQWRDEVLGRVRLTTEWARLADRQLVLEAVAEDLAVKSAVFRRLDEVLTSSEAVFASNTSSIPIGRLARAVRRPESVVGMHFFHPVGAMPLVELVGTLATRTAIRETAEAFAVRLGKEVVWSPDRAGFTVNALLIPFLLSAIRMVECDFASAESVDRAMTLGCNHPMGPLRLADMIGLDIVAAVAAALYDEFKEPLYAPPSLLLRMVDGGLLGRKTGRGFHVHT